MTVPSSFVVICPVRMIIASVDLFSLTFEKEMLLCVAKLKWV